jgi:hypothetical protein
MATGIDAALGDATTYPDPLDVIKLFAEALQRERGLILHSAQLSWISALTLAGTLDSYAVSSVRADLATTRL